MQPDNYTIAEKMIAVGDGHTLYAQLWGNNDAAETIIFLHGGPGSGCSDNHKTNFDPTRQRVIFFDQRGCGKSLPAGKLEANTTDHSIADITKVADEFSTSTFALTGGSWGSCLALAYALKHPKKVTRMVLRGLFTARKSEINFINNGEFAAFFPEVWEEFLQNTPADKRANAADYHTARLLGDDPIASKESAYALSRLEGSVLRLDDRMAPATADDFAAFDPNGMRIEHHFISQACFLPEGHILANASKITMPITLIQGRYDAVCPPYTAYELSKTLPNARLVWTTAGHSGSDRANWEATRAALASI